MVARVLIAALVALVFVPPASAADKVWEHEASGARKALARSVDAGYITPAEQADYLSVLSYAAEVRGRIPRGRALVLRNVLAQVARPKSPIAARALELYTTLRENASYFDVHPLPPDGTDLTGSDGRVRLRQPAPRGGRGDAAGVRHRTLVALLAGQRVGPPLPGLRDRAAEAARQADRRPQLARGCRPLFPLRDAAASADGPGGDAN